MIEVATYEEGGWIQDHCLCGECEATLVCCWGGAFGRDSYIVRCTRDISHQRLREIKSLTRMWKDGEELPCFIRDNIERKMRRQIMEQNNVKVMVVKQDAGKLSTYLQARFSKDLVNPQAALDFAKWCIAHQLEPIRDCIPYHGNPFITVEWLDRKASGDSNFKGYSYKVYSEQDKVSLDFDPKDLVVECQADFEGLKKPLVGLGVVTKVERESRTGGEIDEVTAKGYRSPVVHSKPQQMVFKRSRAAALKQRYHIPAPILEELPYTTVIEAEYKVIEDKPYQPESAGEANSATKGGNAEITAEETNREPGARPLPKAKAQAKKSESAPSVPPDEQIEGEGFHIGLAWLKEALTELKWSDDTCKTFLVSQYKVSPEGSLEDVIKRLTREQAEEFVKTIQEKVAQKQTELFG